MLPRRSPPAGAPALLCCVCLAVPSAGEPAVACQHSTTHWPTVLAVLNSEVAGIRCRDARPMLLRDPAWAMIKGGCLRSHTRWQLAWGEPPAHALPCALCASRGTCSCRALAAWCTQWLTRLPCTQLVRRLHPSTLWQRSAFAPCAVLQRALRGVDEYGTALEK